MRGNEICSKVLTKFESDDKKFQKFLIREHSKSRNKMSRIREDQKGQEANPETARNVDETVLDETKF